MLCFAMRFCTSLLTVFILAGCAVHAGRAPEIVEARGHLPETIRIDTGNLTGVSAPTGRTFLGIPYAAAPVGALRWKPPQPAVPWEAARDASGTRPACIQALGFGIVVGQEDCLYLNVYTPPGSSRRSGGTWPVMAFIPGGAFVTGAGDNYDPSRLATSQDVVVVTINYRLGALGFLAHPALRAENPEGGSGNFGLLDQQAALRWIHDNIHAFGGDSRNVTLFGESAGAWSACYQMVSPAAAGLFNRVILESGSCTDQQSSVSEMEAEQDASAFANTLGCVDTISVLACMRGVSAQSVARAKGTRWGIEAKASWGPVWGDPVMPLEPTKAFASGRYNIVPAIIGTNHDEGRLFAFHVKSCSSYENQLRNDDGPAASLVETRYPVSVFPSSKEAYVTSVTDSRFACPSDQLRWLIAARAPVYGYEFDDEQAPVRIPQFLTGPMGAFHTSELVYVFGTPWALADPTEFSPNQAALSNRLMAAWGRFAYGKAPMGNWPKFAGPNPTILDLRPEGDTISIGFAARHFCNFWQKFPYIEMRRAITRRTQG